MCNSGSRPLGVNITRVMGSDSRHAEGVRYIQVRACYIYGHLLRSQQCFPADSRCPNQQASAEQTFAGAAVSRYPAESNRRPTPCRYISPIRSRCDTSGWSCALARMFLHLRREALSYVRVSAHRLLRGGHLPADPYAIPSCACPRHAQPMADTGRLAGRTLGISTNPPHATIRAGDDL